LLSGVRRYYKTSQSFVVPIATLDLNTPASTPVRPHRRNGGGAHHRKGAPELVRFWSEAPLVREPDVTLYGIERLDPPEQESSANRRCGTFLAADIQIEGSGRASHDALTQVHAEAREFVLHLDIDVIAVEEFPA